VQVSEGTLQTHPAPLIAVAVNPTDSESVTVTTPGAAPLPEFVTVIVYVAPIWLGAKLPA
jgi:hypothetical protein